MISKIIVEILCKWNSYAFFYFEPNSYILYSLSDEKVGLQNIIIDIFFKSNSIFLLF